MIKPRRQLCQWQHPSVIAQELIKNWGEEGFIWLDGDGSKIGRWVTLAIEPIEQICCRGLPKSKAASNPFEALRALTPGHWTGWLSYEAAAWIEPSNSWRVNDMATLWIASHDPVLKFDLEKQQLWLEGCDKNRFQKFAAWVDKIQTEGNAEMMQKESFDGIPVEEWKWLTQENDYLKNVNHIKDLIRSGDIFQANLTTCCTTSLPHTVLATDLFRRLRMYSPAPFAGVVVGAGEASKEAIISTSPERFIKVLATGEVETRPIKGTRPRDANPQRDAAMATDLVCSPKDRAENIMIVDLLRNDLGRVCKPGSITVPQLVGLESYSQVHHLTSIVKGYLRPNKTWVDLLEACWPGGSISGAPKLRACQRLYELEPTSRGPYCGSMININWNGTFDSNILIRSLMLQDKTLRAHAGCGIVADSDSEKEVEELNWKLMPILNALR